MAFHLLGSWNVTSAYRVVADLLGSDSEKVEWLLGDAVTTTSHRVMFNLFDGDMAPMKGLIENPGVDVYVRRRMFDLLGMLMLRGSWSGTSWWLICATCMAGWKAIRRGWSGPDGRNWLPRSDFGN